ncbi:MAG TPA: acetyl-CoA C-acyltransferase [Accumulibacter sp.]|uniref:acetyl-CoA C-acyltransferase n=2 Tax=Accumulibacter sp. TaxID=2053492 RepID=UPI00287A84D9|nr:acetyl-CoA C-acyltransferase [Accumulibacter sp.]MDS4053425.1 acetyl-CoA C-acyltransferase [Accumulibacter sp.]HMV04904.1 acetyl-CoA C-acyltransferase [Accumulibacter sp.]HMW64679.1 acetyl-CoA C-acyltransferase [Accumulibacter sp.]HMW81429.1 acetyl-CoA C-acyltransferase [Accumulibacter sp.]HMX68329.1 acetyl-CoA C-acyltransferase [Accumulibacter sp.]
MSEAVVIVGAKRTPVGAFQGQFAGLTAPQLAAVAIKAAVAQSGVNADDIDEALMGCCLMAGLRQAPARQAVLGAGLPKSVPCTTLTKMCSSAQKTVMLAHDQLLAGSINVAVAGGMESMTNAPHVLTSARSGYRLGHGQLFDHMFLDGLEDAYEPGKLMGAFAELCVEKYGFTREEMDAFAIQSVTRAQQAVTAGVFAAEIAPVTVTTRKGEEMIALDETPMKCDVSKIAKLKPAFKRDGAVTPANSSSISDGAAAFVLMRESDAKRAGLTPLARIVGHSTFAHEPAWFTTAPVFAFKKLLAKAGWQAADVDLWEINEAFAAVTMASMRDLNLAADKVNVNGGACALGHPIGATGSRILVTLLYALKARGLQRGIAGLCAGGGEATAIAIEVL